MKTAVLLVCVVGLVARTAAEKYHKRVGIPTATKIRLQESKRIAGGLNSYKGEHPFFAGLIITLKSGDTSICGGALISHRLVVTIGQCWYDGEHEGREMLVVLGSNTLFGNDGIRNYANWTIVHPQYNPDSLANDLAAVRIPSLTYNSSCCFSDYIKPIQFLATNLQLRDYLAQIIGMGKTRESPNDAIQGSASLRDVYVKILDTDFCRFVYGSKVKGLTLCTSGDRQRGACDGDYGGPLILRRYQGKDMLVGLVSMTSAAGCNVGDPTGYTRISDFTSWIKYFW